MVECNEKCEVFSRVVGYYRPVRNWHDGKKEEFRQRKTYSESKSLENGFHPVGKGAKPKVACSTE